MIASSDLAASLREAAFKDWLRQPTKGGINKYRDLENIFLLHDVKDPFPIVWNGKNSARLDTTGKWVSAWTEFLICMQETLNEK